jgi:hypothetical protein
VLGIFSCSVANAQVEKILGHVASWVLQKQLEELEKENDTSRGLGEYNAKNKFDSRDQHAPRYQPTETSAFRGYNQGDKAVSYESQQSFAPGKR